MFLGDGKSVIMTFEVALEAKPYVLVNFCPVHRCNSASSGPHFELLTIARCEYNSRC